MSIGYILMFGIVLIPVYIMLLGWFAGSPRDLRLSLTGLAYVVTITTAMWGGLALFAAILALLFF